jgi:hypothetical protein
VREAVSQVVKVFGRWDASLLDERLNLLASWLSILPGNYRHTRRYQYLLNVNYADMALIWASYTGEKRNPHLQDEYLCTFETSNCGEEHFKGVPIVVLSTSLQSADQARALALGARRYFVKPDDSVRAVESICGRLFAVSSELVDLRSRIRISFAAIF